MELSKRADYGMRVIMDLATLAQGERTSSRDLARRQFIPLPFLTKIISQLSTAKLIETQRGANGGIWLARPANQISMKEVFEALEGPILLNRCLIHPQKCPMQLNCAVHDVWGDIQTHIITVLGETTFDDLLRQQQAKRQKEVNIELN